MKTYAISETIDDLLSEGNFAKVDDGWYSYTPSLCCKEHAHPTCTCKEPLQDDYNLITITSSEIIILLDIDENNIAKGGQKKYEVTKDHLACGYTFRSYLEAIVDEHGLYIHF